jgi:hypothetical protein
MSMSEIRSSIAAADRLSSGVHADLHGRGNSAELAQAIHALCDAVGELADEVERIQRK